MSTYSAYASQGMPASSRHSRHPGRQAHAWHHILDNTHINSIIHCQPSSHHARLRAFTFCDGHVPHPHHRASPDPTYHVFVAFGCSKRPIDRHIHHLDTVTVLGTLVSASVSTYPTGCWNDRCHCFTASSSISCSGRCQFSRVFLAICWAAWT